MKKEHSYFIMVSALIGIFSLFFPWFNIEGRLIRGIGSSYHNGNILLVIYIIIILVAILMKIKIIPIKILSNILLILGITSTLIIVIDGRVALRTGIHNTKVGLFIGIIASISLIARGVLLRNDIIKFKNYKH